MPDTVIKVENLGKRYFIGHQRSQGDDLRHAIDEIIRSPRGWLRSLLARRASRREEFWALRDINFEIKQGQAVAVIGRNGAGKSTLLKVLSRITEPTRGRISVRGRVASLLEVGTGFHQELTGRENIFLNGAILGMTQAEIRRKFDEIVAFSGVEKFLDTPVKRYSSGMYVRLAFAVAAHLEPEILIIDEVLAVGDEEFQRKCLGKMKDVATGGRTVLFVSHTMSAVQNLCQRAILLGKGGVICDGTAADTVRFYLQQVENSASVDLKVRTDRSGRGRSRLCRIELEVEPGMTTEVLSLGRPARFIFGVTENLRRMEFIFTIFNERGEAVASFESVARSPEDRRDDDENGRFVCEVDELVLMAGNYRIDAAVVSEGILEDHIEGAMSFRVQPASLRGREIIPDSFYSVTIPHRWILPRAVI